jgi:competence protein ComEA
MNNDHAAQAEHGSPFESLVTDQTSMENPMEPTKRSLIVNINTASEEELESLPDIGPSRADEIIAHRPYKAVDELLDVKGISQRIMDGLRPYVKSEGSTEKLKPAK